jgi:hypothetical protein
MCFFKYNVSIDDSMGEITVNNNLDIDSAYRSPNMIDSNCSDFFTFNFVNDSLSASLQSDVESLLCTFDVYN